MNSKGGENKMKKVLENNQVRVVFNDDCINFYDLLDQYNDQKGFTKNVRGIAKTWDLLMEEFTENTSFFEVARFLDDHKLNTHIYCGMD